ncbi:MAG: methyltransferase, partial [Okeania sp. SIO3B3]|nr:methyltransferase [Okeania sp. SIO3B3]
VIAKLGIADLLADEPKSSAWLANELELDPTQLHRILLGCVNAGLLRETESGHFATTPATKLLESNRPDSLLDNAILTGEVWYMAWQHLLDGVQNPKHIPFELAFNTDFYTHLTQNSDLGTHFNQFMQSAMVQSAQAFVNNYDISNARVVVDIGGGNGTLLEAVLKKYTHLNAMLYDRPDVVQEAEQRLADENLGNRCQYVGGDFTESIPSGADVYILSRVLHNWSDEYSVQILRKCYAAMQPGAKLLILEQVLPPKLQAAMPVIKVDLWMMVMFQGKERTQADYQLLLSSAGFDVTNSQLIVNESNLMVIEAQKPS